jgi:hypothetical protein
MFYFIKIIVVSLLTSLFALSSNGQSESIITKRIVDEATGKALPYANIYNPRTQSGVISNEDGYFTIDISKLEPSDSIRFQYVGYLTKNIAVTDIVKIKTVSLNGRIVDVSEMVVYAEAPNAKAIVKKVLENKTKNYKKSITKQKVFIRNRQTTKMIDKEINFVKSDIPKLDKILINKLNSSIPEVSTSFSDFLGIAYRNENLPDSLSFKLNPIRKVVLKEKDFTELEELEKIFEDAIKKMGKDEYWKFKSGIISQKIDMGDTAQSAKKKDSLPKNYQKTKYTSRSVKRKKNFSNFNNKREWHFLHKPGKYKFTTIGGTSVNGEDVYVIDFEPAAGGMYEGRLFISTETYALVKADYKYAEGKDGITFNMFGIAYKELGFNASIYFVKRGDDYQLKYYSIKQDHYFKFDRTISLLKKKDKFLFDRKQNEMKLGIKISANSEDLLEYMVIDDQEISNGTFNKAIQPELMKIHFVEQFNDELWRGYDIIEPTRQMRTYKKHKEAE